MTRFHAHSTWGKRLLLVFTAALLSIATFPALADEGHDHGHDHGAPAAEAAASPRFEAHSDLFELVGVVEKGQLTVYLDRYATNEPVTGAKIEFESGAAKGVAAPQPDGTYLIRLDALSKPGHVPFAFTVTAGSDTDLLAGELELKDPQDHPHEEGQPWARWAGFAAAGLAALALAALAARKFAARRVVKEVP